MNTKAVTLVAIACLMFSFGLPKSLEKMMTKAIKKQFDVETVNLQEKKFPEALVSTLPSKFNKGNFFEISSNQSALGYAYISKAASKTDEFDYLVVFDLNMVVVKTKVLIYREDYGGEIGSKRWLKQFIGKTKNDELLYGDTIMAISGATISVKSMTTAMNNLLTSIKILHTNKAL